MKLKSRLLNILLMVLFMAGCGNDLLPHLITLDRCFNAWLGYALFTPAEGFSSRGVEIAMQSNGKIIVLGSTVSGADDDMLLVRYTKDGRIDPRFGVNGYVRYGDFDRDRGLGLAVLPGDDTIIVTGYSTIAGSRELLTVKFSADGAFVRDLLYSDLGTDIGFGITITPDRKIVVIGESSSSLSQKQDLLILRMDADLQLDPGFGRWGAVHYNGPANENEKGFAVAAQPDGKLVACGAVIVTGKEDMLLLRLNQDGSLDDSFGTNGVVIWAGPAGGADYANNLALQPDGKILIAGAVATGASHQITILRFLSSGQLDAGFGQDGFVSYPGLTGADAYPYGIIVKPNGNIVVAGSSLNSEGNKDAIALGYTASGQSDLFFGVRGLFVFDGTQGGDDVANGLALQPDRAILATGYSSNGLSDEVLTFRLK